MEIISKKIVGFNGVDKMQIHGLNIGKLAIKKTALYSKNPGILSTLLSFRDKEFSDWLPIWTWVIVHPEGTFLIDTGLSSDVHQNGYFKDIDFISKYYCEKQMKFDIKREDEIDHQLKKVGIDSKSISNIVLTHLHIDHTGGLKYFPNIPILVNENEWKTKDGSFPKLFPTNIRFESLKLDSEFELFERCHYLTQRKDLFMLSTPGHTRGHVSIGLLASDNKMYLFGGDVAYTKERLINKKFSSTIKNQISNKESCNKILELAKRFNLVFLPSHDPDNMQRLNNDEII